MNIVLKKNSENRYYESRTGDTPVYYSRIGQSTVQYRTEQIEYKRLCIVLCSVKVNYRIVQHSTAVCGIA